MEAQSIYNEQPIANESMLSHHHKTIFIHIPKCAGQSIETAFLMDLGLTWESRAPLLLRENDLPILGPPRLAHLLATDYVNKKYVTPEMFQSYFRFTVVRNPWSRAVSLYKHLALDLTFERFVSDWLPREFDNRDKLGSYWFIRPQHDYIYASDVLLVSEIVRFERLADDFERIASVCGLRSKLTHVNCSQDIRRSTYKKPKRPFWRPSRHQRVKSWQDLYNDRLISAIARLYEADLNALGYTYDGC